MCEMVSCIISTYKREVTILKRAIDSIVNQTYKDIEIIVVNDAPEEEKLANEIKHLISTYDIKINYIVHEKNSGACAARNTGLSASKGDYVAFLDDDDEWLPSKIEKQVNALNETGAYLVYCDYYQIAKSGKKRIDVSYPELAPFETFFKKLLCVNIIGSTSFPLIKKEAFDTVGGFNTELKSSQDYEMWLRIAERFSVTYINEPLINYYVGDDSITSNYSNIIQGTNYLLHKYNSFYSDHKDVLNCRMNYLAMYELSRRKYKLFLKHYLKAVEARPLARYNFLVVRAAIGKITRKNT